MATRVSVADAKKMAKNYDEMPNDVLLSMAVMGDQEAREERLIREIMSVDNVSWYVNLDPLKCSSMCLFLLTGKRLSPSLSRWSMPTDVACSWPPFPTRSVF